MTESFVCGNGSGIACDAERKKVIQKVWGPSHLIPLSRQTTALLKKLRQLSGNHEHLFPEMRNPRGPISSETINKALKIMGFEGEQTGHGFRGPASTIMNEPATSHRT